MRERSVTVGARCVGARVSAGEGDAGRFESTPRLCVRLAPDFVGVGVRSRHDETVALGTDIPDSTDFQDCIQCLPRRATHPPKEISHGGGRLIRYITASSLIRLLGGPVYPSNDTVMSLAAAVNPTSAGFRGGLYAQSTPTNIGGSGFASPGQQAALPPGVPSGGQIKEARNNSGTNVRVPYARKHAYSNPLPAHAHWSGGIGRGNAASEISSVGILIGSRRATLGVKLLLLCVVWRRLGCVLPTKEGSGLHLLPCSQAWCRSTPAIKPKLAVARTRVS